MPLHAPVKTGASSTFHVSSRVHSCKNRFSRCCKRLNNFSYQKSRKRAVVRFHRSTPWRYFQVPSHSSSRLSSTSRFSAKNFLIKQANIKLVVSADSRTKLARNPSAAFAKTSCDRFVSSFVVRTTCARL